MKRSKVVEQTYLRFCDRLSAKDVASFDTLVSTDPSVMIVGTAPGEIVTERPRLRFGFETEGITLKPNDPVGYADKSMGWSFDEPLFGFPDGSAIRVRLSMFMRREEEGWKMVHAHFSVGVPDEEVVALQKKWAEKL